MIDQFMFQMIMVDWALFGLYNLCNENNYIIYSLRFVVVSPLLQGYFILSLKRIQRDIFLVYKFLKNTIYDLLLFFFT